MIKTQNEAIVSILEKLQQTEAELREKIAQERKLIDELPEASFSRLLAATCSEKRVEQIIAQYCSDYGKKTLNACRVLVEKACTNAFAEADFRCKNIFYKRELQGSYFVFNRFILHEKHAIAKKRINQCPLRFSSREDASLFSETVEFSNFFTHPQAEKNEICYDIRNKECDFLSFKACLEHVIEQKTLWMAFRKLSPFQSPEKILDLKSTTLTDTAVEAAYNAKLKSCPSDEKKLDVAKALLLQQCSSIFYSSPLFRTYPSSLQEQLDHASLIAELAKDPQ